VIADDAVPISQTNDRYPDPVTMPIFSSTVVAFNDLNLAKNI
jgi:hypothetical protein